MGYDAWVIVGTKLDSKQLERDLKQAERRLQQYEKEAEKLTKAKTKAEIDLQPYEDQKKIIQEMTDESLQHAKTQQEVEQILKAEKIQMEELNQKYSKQLENIEEINNKIQENTKNQELMKNEIAETGNKLKQAKMKEGIEDIGNSVSKTIKKVAKWALAIFSVRSAYMAVRNAMSVLTQYNDDLARKLESIKLVFVSALEPLITRIVDLVYSLLGAINSIAKAWFNVDLFASASAKAMKSGASSAEKMKKALTGFDEMNILTDTSSSGGVASPTVDFSDVEETDLSGIYKLTDNIKKVFDKAFKKIKQNIIKVMLDLGFSNRFIGMWETLADGIKTLIDGLLDFIGGILGFIVGMVTGDTEKVKESVKKLVKGIGEMVAGLFSIIIGNLGMAVATIIDSFLSMVNWIYKNVIKPIGEWFSGLWNGIVDGFNIAINWIKNTFNSMVNFFRDIINTIVGLFKNIGTKVGDAIGGAFKTVVNGVLKAIESILNSPIKAINSLINTINKVPGINISKLPTFSLPRLAVGGIVNMPGRGINYGGANIAERGAEGVIPLTNSQMMAQLGEAIGKYVNINATVPVYVGNRQIAREIKKISADNDFAFNR